MEKFIRIQKNAGKIKSFSFKKTILNMKFKFQVQDSFLNFFFEIWRFERRIALSEKKTPLENKVVTLPTIIR